MPTNTVTPEDVPQDSDVLVIDDEFAEVLRELRPPGVTDEQINALVSRFHGKTIRMSALLAAEADLKAGGAR